VPAFELPFIVEGPWDDPLPMWDVQSRIQRSPPAQQLLDAMRNRPADDPIRQAIERLTGAAPAPAAQPEPAAPAPPEGPALAGAPVAPSVEAPAAPTASAPEAAQPAR
jgi:AsmA protein